MSVTAGTADFGVTNSSSISQKLSGSMKKGMTKLKGMNWENIIFYGLVGLLTISVISYIGSNMYYDIKDKKQKDGHPSAPPPQCRPRKNTSQQVYANDEQEDQL